MLSRTASRVSSREQKQPQTGKPSVWRRFKSAFRRQWMFYTMMIPGMALIILFCYVPMPGVALAFKDYKPALGIWGSEWIDPWYKNFEFFFKSDTAARVTFNTIFYNVHIGFSQQLPKQQQRGPAWRRAGRVCVCG